MGRKKNRAAKIGGINHILQLLEESNAMILSGKYDVLDDVIENVYEKCVKLNDEETEALTSRFKSNDVLAGAKDRTGEKSYETKDWLVERRSARFAAIKVIEIFIEKMKEVDDTFDKIFNRIYYTGSFFDGLRICEATEFDLNLVLKPNIYMEPIRKQRRPPGFTSIKVSEYSFSNVPEFKNWTTKSLLNPNSVKGWLQRVAHKAVKKIKEEENLIHNCELKLRQSGPAWTLSITSKKSPRKTLDVDLVPVLEFNTRKRGIGPLKKGDIRSIGLNEPWFAVPKPPSNCPNCGYLNWRMSFAIQEAAIIKDLKFFKYTLKMIKRVRDVLGIDVVASYHIKNLFLLELQKSGRAMWAESRRGLLFMTMLESLKKALNSRKIPYFWHEDYNLIKNVPEATLDNMAGRLNNFCAKINRLIETGKSPEQQKKDHEELKTWLETVLIAPQDQGNSEGSDSEDSNSEESDSEIGSDDEVETLEVSPADGLKAVETLTKYFNQQGRASKDDFETLHKWKELLKRNQ